MADQSSSPQLFTKPSMEETNPLKIHPTKRENEVEEWRKLYQDLIQTLPTQISFNGNLLHLYEGFWYATASMKGLLYFQKQFKPERGDVFLASNPKSGTNWLSALAFAVVNRSRYSLNDTPLLGRTARALARYKFPE